MKGTDPLTTDFGAGLAPAPYHQLSGDSLPPGQAFFVTAKDGVRLRLALWTPDDAPRGTILLFTGRTEYVEKYAPIAPRLTAAGYAVVTLDWRGQGLSDRLLADPRVGYINDFAEYQTDVAALVATATGLELPRPWHLLAHSMGGCIGLAALMNGLPVESAVFSAPMWGLARWMLPAPLITGIATAAGGLGQGPRSAIGTGGRGTYLLDEPFRGNMLTGDAVQWARLVAEAGSWPEMTLGGASYHWVMVAMAECARLAALPSPKLPALIGLGLLENVVAPAAIRSRGARWSEARLLEFPATRHEILFEQPPAPDIFLSAALELFRSHG